MRRLRGAWAFRQAAGTPRLKEREIPRDNQGPLAFRVCELSHAASLVANAIVRALRSDPTHEPKDQKNEKDSS
jgi:hypothetical protein